MPNKFRNESQGRLGPWFTKSVFTVFRLDSTTISLCLKISDWAQHPRRKGRIKLHALLNNDTGLPEVIDETAAKTSDRKGAALILDGLSCGSIVVMGRGYNDYRLFKELTDPRGTFVSRLKDNTKHTLLKDAPISEAASGKWGTLRDDFYWPQAVKVCGQTKFRVLQWHDETTKRWSKFLTNNRQRHPQETANLYKDRWQIELFFKKIKQNLKVKSFVDTSENAVMTQIWTTAIAVIILELLKRRASYK